MAHFIFVELSCLYEIRPTDSFFLREVDFDFSATTSTSYMLHHVLLEFVDCMPVWSGSNVKHQAELWLKVLADALKEPLVTVNLSVISLFNSKDQVDPSSL